MKEVYLDNASTTMPDTKVFDAMSTFLTTYWQNPSSLYSDANRVKNAIQDARKTIGDFINADANEVYFTSSGSEANCWAIQGFVKHIRSNGGEPFIITTQIEHHSIMECVRALNGGFSPVAAAFISVDKDGFVDANQLTDALEWGVNFVDAPECILVSISLANNEIGTIQDIKAISDIVHKYGAVLHVDAVQAFGHIPIGVKDMDIDMLSASAHKICAAKGTGILYKKTGVHIEPIIYGSQEQSLRGGTENVAGIVGMAKAVEIADMSLDTKLNMCVVQDYFINELEKIGCKLNGSRSNRLQNNINVMLPEGVGGEEVLYMLDLSGIQCSTGSACNSRSKEPSHVLRAVGLTDEEAARCIRMTISEDTTTEDIDYVVNEISKAIKVICG